MKTRIGCLLIICCLLILGCNIGFAISEEAQSVGFWEQVENALYNYSVERFGGKRGILTEDPEAYDYADEFLSAALNHNTVAMKALFAPNAISEIDETQLEAMLTDFIDYFQADSYALEIPIGPQTSECRDHGKKSKELKAPLEITTDKNEYRLAIKCVAYDDWAQDNIGIWSICMIEKAKDTDPDRPYYGDLKYKTGIYIDVERPER